jgi:hypothetical protein
VIRIAACMLLALAGCKDRCTAKNASKSICTTRHGVAGDVTTCVYECYGSSVTEPRSAPESDPVLAENAR